MIPHLASLCHQPVGAGVGQVQLVEDQHAG